MVLAGLYVVIWKGKSMQGSTVGRECRDLTTTYLRPIHQHTKAVLEEAFSFTSWRQATPLQLARLFTASWHGGELSQSPTTASKKEVRMIYIRCYQCCSQPAIIPIIIIA